MNLSNRKIKFYAFLLVAAVTGLLIDRSQRVQKPGAGDKASAQAGPEIDAMAEPDFSMIGPSVAAIFRADRAPGSRIGQERSSKVTGRVRDVFALAPEMIAYYRSQSQRETEKKKAEEHQKQQQMQQTVDAFRAEHLLKGTFIQPDDVWAVINDRILRVGDRLAGFELRRIERYRVLFRKEDVVIVLELPNPLDAQVQPAKQR